MQVTKVFKNILQRSSISSNFQSITLGINFIKPYLILNNNQTQERREKNKKNLLLISQILLVEILKFALISYLSQYTFGLDLALKNGAHKIITANIFFLISHGIIKFIDLEQKQLIDTLCSNLSNSIYSDVMDQYFKTHLHLNQDLNDNERTRKNNIFLHNSDNIPKFTVNFTYNAIKSTINPIISMVAIYMLFQNPRNLLSKVSSKKSFFSLYNMTLFPVSFILPYAIITNMFIASNAQHLAKLYSTRRALRSSIMSDLKNIETNGKFIANNGGEYKERQTSEFYSKAYFTNEKKYAHKQESRNSFKSYIYNLNLALSNILILPFIDLKLIDIKNIGQINSYINYIVDGVSFWYGANADRILNLKQRVKELDSIINNMRNIENTMEKSISNSTWKTNKNSGLVEITNLKINFKDITLESRPNKTASFPIGKVTRVFAPSGKGKTSFLLALARLVKDYELEAFYDPDILENTIKSNKQINTPKISMVLQSDKSTQEPLLQFITSYLVTNRSHEKIIKKTKELMKLFGIRETIIKDFEKLHTSFSNLSGGEKKKMSLILALLQKPDILILDETTSSIDGEYRHTITQYLRGLKTTILFVEHEKDTKTLKQLKEDIKEKPFSCFEDHILDLTDFFDIINVKTNNKKISKEGKISQYRKRQLSYSTNIIQKDNMTKYLEESSESERNGIHNQLTKRANTMPNISGSGSDSEDSENSKIYNKKLKKIHPHTR